MASSSEKLLLLLLRQGSCSRADLAKSMHLSRPAVSSLVDGLVRLERQQNRRLAAARHAAS